MIGPLRRLLFSTPPVLEWLRLFPPVRPPVSGLPPWNNRQFNRGRFNGPRFVRPSPTTGIITRRSFLPFRTGSRVSR